MADNITILNEPAKPPENLAAARELLSAPVELDVRNWENEGVWVTDSNGKRKFYPFEYDVPFELTVRLEKASRGLQEDPETFQKVVNEAIYPCTKIPQSILKRMPFTHKMRTMFKWISAVEDMPDPLAETNAGS